MFVEMNHRIGVSDSRVGPFRCHQSLFGCATVGQKGEPLSSVVGSRWQSWQMKNWSNHFNFLVHRYITYIFSSTSMGSQDPCRPTRSRIVGSSIKASQIAAQPVSALYQSL